MVARTKPARSTPDGAQGVAAVLGEGAQRVDDGHEPGQRMDVPVRAEHGSPCRADALRNVRVYNALMKFAPINPASAWLPPRAEDRPPCGSECAHLIRGSLQGSHSNGAALSTSLLSLREHTCLNTCMLAQQVLWHCPATSQVDQECSCGEEGRCGSLSPNASVENDDQPFLRGYGALHLQWEIADAL